MVMREASREDRVESAVVSSNAGKDCCEVIGAAGMSDAEVVSLEGGEDDLAAHNQG